MSEQLQPNKKSSKLRANLDNAFLNDYKAEIELRKQQVENGKLVDFNYVFAHGAVEEETLINIPANCIVLTQCNNNVIYFNFGNDLRKLMFIADLKDSYIMKNDHNLNKSFIENFFTKFGNLFNKPKTTVSNVSQNALFCCFTDKCPNVSISFENDLRKLYVTTSTGANFIHRKDKIKNTLFVYDIMQNYFLNNEAIFKQLSEIEQAKLLIDFTVQIGEKYRDGFDKIIVPLVQKQIQNLYPNDNDPVSLNTKLNKVLTDYYEVVDDAYYSIDNNIRYNALLRKYAQGGNTELKLSDYLKGLHEQEPNAFHIVVLNVCRSGETVATNVSGNVNKQLQQYQQNKVDGMFQLYTNTLTDAVLSKMYSYFNWSIGQSAGRKKKMLSSSTKKTSKKTSKKK